MKYQLIENAKQWDEFYYYSPKYKPNAYPRKYPCIGKIESEGGGLAGEYEAHYVCHFPETKSPNVAFVVGLNPTWEYVC